MQLRIAVCLICLIAPVVAVAEEANLRGYYEVRDDGVVVWTVLNLSPGELIIKDLRNNLRTAGGLVRDPFMRGKEWTRLRPRSAGASTNEISLVLSERIELRLDSDRTVDVWLYVAPFDSNEGRIGQFELCTVKFRPLDQQGGREESAEE